MKKILTAMMMVLAIGVFANAQYFDMQLGSSIIRPEITNDLSHLGAAYTIGTEAGNLTGNYGDYFEFKVHNRGLSGLAVTIASYNADGGLKSVVIDWTVGYVLPVMTNDRELSMIMTADKLFFNVSTPTSLNGLEKVMLDINVFDMIGGYIDYVAISGSGASIGSDALLGIGRFRFGTGWVEDRNNYGFADMQMIRGFNNGFDAPPSFSNGSVNFSGGLAGATYTSNALAWNAETGAAMRGDWGGIFPVWDNLTFTFGSFERVPVTDVPEPATLMMLGLAAAGLPIVRRFRKK